MSAAAPAPGEAEAAEAVSGLPTYPTPFGLRYHLGEHEKAQMIVLAVYRGVGFEPKRLLMPHQVYVADVERLMADWGASEVWVLPVMGPALQVVGPTPGTVHNVPATRGRHS